MCPFPIHAGLSTIFLTCPYASNHSCCKLMWTTAMPYPEDRISQHVSPSVFLTFFLSSLSQWSLILVGLANLGLNTQWALALSTWTRCESLCWLLLPPKEALFLVESHTNVWEYINTYRHFDNCSFSRTTVVSFYLRPIPSLAVGFWPDLQQ